MSFVFNEAEFKKESEEFYSTYPVDVSEIENELNQRYEKEKVSAMVQKKWTYEAIAQKCKVKVFRYCPFYSEVITGRDRNSVAGALANAFREKQTVEIQAVGAGSLNQAIKAIAIARGYVAPTGKDLICIPAFSDIMIDGEERTAIKLIVESRK